MQTSEIQNLFEYNYWANARILAAAANLTEAQLIAPAKLSHGGLRGTLLHTLSAEWIWRKRCQEKVSPTALLSVDEFPTLVELQTRWQAEEAAMRSYLAGLRDEDLLSTVQYASTTGKPLENLLWQILVHVVNHGTQTRSEAAILLTEYGYSPGDLDLILYFRDYT